MDPELIQHLESINTRLTGAIRESGDRTRDGIRDAFRESEARLIARLDTFETRLLTAFRQVASANEEGLAGLALISQANDKRLDKIEHRVRRLEEKIK